MTEPEGELDLVEACLSGDADAWAAFVDRYTPFLYACIVKTLTRTRGTCSTEEADHAYQDVFWELFRNDHRALRGFKGKSKLSTYLWVIAHRKAIELAKRGLHRALPLEAMGDLPDGGQAPDAGLQREELRSKVRLALEKVPGRDRDILKLFYFENLSLQRISDRTGLSRGAVAMALHRGRKRMAGFLKKNPETP